MAKGKILVVDDEEHILELIRYNLDASGYEVIEASDGDDAVKKAINEVPDLILLDLMLPGKDGYDVCRELRSNGKTKAVPIIMLTAKSEEIDKILGLELGSDDYITKPFSVVVLHKRIEALQRRIQGRQQNNKWIYKDVEVDFLGFCAKKDNNPVDLKPKEIKLLELLIKHKNQVLTRNQMLDSLWEIDEAPADRVIDVYIKNLRKKLDLDCITTVKGIGYKFEDK